MEVVGNTLHFPATFFIKIESQCTVDNKRMVFYISGVKGKVVLDLVTNWFREMLSFLEEGGGLYFCFPPQSEKFEAE